MLRSSCHVALAAFVFGLVACSGDAVTPNPDPGGPGPQPGTPNGSHADPANPTDPAEPDPLTPGAKPLPSDLAREDGAAQLAFDQLSAEVARLRGLDAAGALAEYPVEQLAELGYAPGSAEFMDRIQASALALNQDELDVLERRGFVVSRRQQFPTFLRGYAAIYQEHLPVYVSADAMLDAVHRSYDRILAVIESSVLQTELAELLAHMRGRIGNIDASDQTKADLELYLRVAADLLASTTSPFSGEKLQAGTIDAATLVALAEAAEGTATVPLFGIERSMDFSQFTPRGHYTDGLERYFRAMMWLGRVDFRIIETQSNGSLTFNRGQYEAVLAFEQLMDARARELWDHIDGAIRTFVGESDSMTVPQIAELIADLGGPQAALSASDVEVATALSAGGYGEQQIASHLMVNDGTVKTLPLNRSFLLFGQRYVVDSHVFSAVVYDRIDGRMMPNPLDAAFAALGNNQALRLVPDLEAVSELPGALAGMRHLVDSHAQSFWDANLYNLWSSALRALSPAPDLSAPGELGLPSVAGTEAWGRRLLNTQLGSWSQLRHDTLLYAKQSYTGIPGCEFPDAYIEPYPAFFGALVRYAERGEQIAAIAADVPGLGPAIVQYFATLRTTAARLQEMAEQQLNGTPHNEEQLAFINDAVRIELLTDGCVTEEVPNGWYAALFFEREKSIEQDLTIADVHTQPADEAGNLVGKVLHVGTSFPRMMTVTVDTCVGPRAYAGMAYAYHEHITENFERMTDESWTERVGNGDGVADVNWVRDFVAGDGAPLQ